MNDGSVDDGEWFNGRLARGLLMTPRMAADLPLVDTLRAALEPRAEAYRHRQRAKSRPPADYVERYLETVNG